MRVGEVIGDDSELLEGDGLSIIRRTDGYPWMQSGKPQGELFDEGPIQGREG
jgi:hypothetical protein